MQTMKRKQKHNQPQRSNMEADSKADQVDGCKESGIVASIEVPKPRVTSFVAAPCSSCQALRDSDDKANGKSYSRVYGTVERVRYCRCDYCGSTWKQTPDSTT